MGNDNEYFDDEEFREILNEYEEAVKSGQTVFMDADDLADIADYYQLNNRFEEAKQAMERAMELEPDSVVALDYKVREALTFKDYEAAEEYLDLMGDDQLPEYIYCRAEIWIAQGMVEKADRYLRMWLKEVTEDEYQDYIYDVVNLWAEYDNHQKALEWMMRANPEESETFMELMGRIYFGAGDYYKAESTFNQLIDMDPFQKRYWKALANAQYMKEDYSAAVTSSEYAIAIDPEDTEALLAKANALYRLDNFEEALKFYERCSEKDPSEFTMLYQGSCLVALRSYNQALDWLKEAERIAPSDSPYLAEIYQELSFVYCELKMFDMALQYIDKTDALACDHADMMVIRGHILLASNRVDEATDTFKRAIRASHYSPKIVMRVAVSVYDNHYLEMAYRLFRKYLNLSDFSIDSLCTDGYSYMALCCYDLMLNDDWLIYLQIACERNPQEAKQVLGHLFPKELQPKQYLEYAKKHLTE